VIETGLVAARFFHFAAVMVLFGLALFPLYSFPSRVGEPPARLIRWLHLSLRSAASLALVSALAWGFFTVANMAGAMSGVADWDTLLSVGRDTMFGRVWLARLAFAVALLAFLGHTKTSYPNWRTVALSAVLLLSLVLVGHTQVTGGTQRVVHMSADGLHLLAAGAWLGGLVTLTYLLTLARRSPSLEHDAAAHTALVRFSGMGYITVSVLIGSGLVNAWFLVGSAAKLATTPYGQVLAVKLCLFGGMLALAGVNRFLLVPSLARLKENGQPATPTLSKLFRSVTSEQLLGLLIVLIVSYLGTTEPAIGSSS
jgi:putative copper resistance protein D